MEKNYKPDAYPTSLEICNTAWMFHGFIFSSSNFQQASQVQPTSFIRSFPNSNPDRWYTFDSLSRKMLTIALLLPSFLLLLISFTSPAHASPVNTSSSSPSSSNLNTPAANRNNSLPTRNAAAAVRRNFNDWSLLGERFCPWCEAGVDFSDGAGPEEKVCRVVVHQPINPSPGSNQFAHVAILNARYTQLLSYRRMG